MSERRRRVAIVAPILERHDAISTAALDSFHTLSGRPGWDVSILTNWTNHAASPASIVAGVAGLLKNAAFRSADVLLYHFGAYDPLFDALVVGNGRARQIVRFHNITPRELLPPSAGAEIDRARAQLPNLRHADRIWAASATTVDELVENGFAADIIDLLPLTVTVPARARFVDKPKPPVEILFVGRIVTSKGVLDLIDAVAAARRAIDTPFRLRVVGNLVFSDPSYVEAVKSAIRAHRLEDTVEFLGTIDDRELARLYHRAHIFALPSYHEGFCKPVIEALRAHRGRLGPGVRPLLERQLSGRGGLGRRDRHLPEHPGRSGPVDQSSGGDP